MGVLGMALSFLLGGEMLWNEMGLVVRLHDCTREEEATLFKGLSSVLR